MANASAGSKGRDAFQVLAGSTAGDTDSSDPGLQAPTGVTLDRSGDLFVADTDNHVIRKISQGHLSILAGSVGITGAADGTGSAARFSYPKSVAVDGAGTVYVADAANHTIRKITPSGMVTTLAGEAGEAGSVDGTAGAARFYYP